MSGTVQSPGRQRASSEQSAVRSVARRSLESRVERSSRPAQSAYRFRRTSVSASARPRARDASDHTRVERPAPGAAARSHVRTTPFAAERAVSASLRARRDPLSRSRCTVGLSLSASDPAASSSRGQRIAALSQRDRSTAMAYLQPSRAAPAPPGMARQQSSSSSPYAGPSAGSSSVPSSLDRGGPSYAFGPSQSSPSTAASSPNTIVRRGWATVKDEGLRSWLPWTKKWLVLREHALTMHKNEVRRSGVRPALTATDDVDSARLHLPQSGHQRPAHRSQAVLHRARDQRQAVLPGPSDDLHHSLTRTVAQG